MRIFYSEKFLDYSHSPAHPESPQRLSYTVSELRRSNSDLHFEEPQPASIEQLSSVHSRAYVEGIMKRSIRWVDEETPVYHNTYDIASLSAGAAIGALRHTLESHEQTLSLIRPPGHHAGVSAGGGFCYFNNVAIAARLSGLNRLAIVDIDVHHGNGTSEIFYGTDKVLYISTHQRGIYPGTGNPEELGDGVGKGYNLNIPLRAGSGDSTFRHAFDTIILPVLGEYKPQAIIVSLGVDSHYMDPLASLSLSTPGYLEAIGKLAQTGIPCAMILEGGYCVEAILDVVVGVINSRKAAVNSPTYFRVSDTECIGCKDIQLSLDRFRQYWPL